MTNLEKWISTKSNEELAEIICDKSSCNKECILREVCRDVPNVPDREEVWAKICGDWLHEEYDG